MCDADENLHLKSVIDITFFVCFTHQMYVLLQLNCNSFSGIGSKLADNLLMMIV